MSDIAFQRDRLASRVAAARATLARREVRIAGRVLALVVVALVALKSKALFSRLGNIGQPNPAWVGAAIAAEIATLLAYSAMVGELLRLGGVTAPVHSFVRPSLVGVAMTASLPGGAAASNVYWWGALRRQGADRRLAALVMAGTSVAGAISLVGLLGVGVALAGNTGPLGHVYVWLVCLAVVLLMLRFVFSHRLSRLLTRALRRIDPKVEPRHLVRVRRLRLTMLFAYANWLLDCAAFYASLQALHAPVPARSVVLVYVIAQLVAQLALLPGGGGTVELTLAAGFAAFGHRGGTLLAGALLYRFLSCWGLIPLGWLGFILERARPQPHTLANPTSSGNPGPRRLATGVANRDGSNARCRTGTPHRLKIAPERANVSLTSCKEVVRPRDGAVSLLATYGAERDLRSPIPDNPRRSTAFSPKRGAPHRAPQSSRAGLWPVCDTGLLRAELVHVAVRDAFVALKATAESRITRAKRASRLH